MAEKHDLVHHPFCVAGRSDAMLAKAEHGYELRFGDAAMSKRVYSSGSMPGKNFIELEITGEEVAALGETPTLHEFITPADFYVPMGEEARSTYEELGDLLAGDNLEELCAMQERFSREGFPECPVPRVTTARHYEGFTGKAGAEPEDSVRCASIRFGDEIPREAPAGLHSYVRRKIGEAGFVVQDRFLSGFFAENKIAKFKQIQESFSREPSLEGQEPLKQTYLKKCVALHAFYYSAGPWRHCWVAFGYDPSTDRANYLYQSVALEGMASPFQLVKYPSIAEEVARNMDWYVLRECDPTAGFISKALRSLISYRVGSRDESRSCETEDRSDSNECRSSTGTS